jgi:hypothetical protein
MRYRVLGLIVKSENAAKPASQSCAAVRDWLRAHPRIDDALDYGCGKLRYGRELIARARRVTFVDSGVQVTRRQRILGRTTSVADLVAQRWPASRVLDLEAFHADRRRYQLILCANVLTAVPCRRTRLAILRTIAERLVPGAQCLIVSQYRNSEFTAVAARPESEPYQDGWLLRARRGPAFYAPLDADQIERLGRRVGLLPRERYLSDGTALCAMARPRHG